MLSMSNMRCTLKSWILTHSLLGHSFESVVGKVTALNFFLITFIV